MKADPTSQGSLPDLVQWQEVKFPTEWKLDISKTLLNKAQQPMKMSIEILGLTDQYKLLKKSMSRKDLGLLMQRSQYREISESVSSSRPSSSRRHAKELTLCLHPETHKDTEGLYHCKLCNKLIASDYLQNGVTVLTKEQVAEKELKYSEPYILPPANAKQQPMESASNWHTNALKEIAKLQYSIISRMHAMVKAKQSATPSNSAAPPPTALQQLVPLNYNTSASSSILPRMFLALQSSDILPDNFPQSKSPFSAEDLADAFNPSFRWGNSAKNLGMKKKRPSTLNFSKKEQRDYRHLPLFSNMVEQAEEIAKTEEWRRMIHPGLRNNQGNAEPKGLKATHPGMSIEGANLCKIKIDQMLKDGLISPSNNPYACQAYVNNHSEQKRGKKRLVINYKPINDWLEHKRFPLPLKDDLLRQIKDCQVFSKFDLKSGFWQFKILPEDRAKTSFVVPQGMFQWNVLPMGLKTAPSLCQERIERIFADCREYVLLYIDDILIYSKDVKSHVQHLQAFINKLQHTGLVLSLKKMEICRAKVFFLGIEIFAGNIQMQDHVLKKINQYPDQLSSKKEVQSFVGCLQWIAPQYPQLAKDLLIFKALDKCKSFFWHERLTRAVQQIKLACSILPPLRIPSDKPLAVYSDASEEAWGGIPCEIDNDEPIICRWASGRFSDTETRPSSSRRHAKELTLCLHSKTYKDNEGLYRCKLCNKLIASDYLQNGVTVLTKEQVAEKELKYSEPYILPPANAKLQPMESASNWHTNALKEIVELQYSIISRIDAMVKAKQSATPSTSAAPPPTASQQLVPLNYNTLASSSILLRMFLALQSSDILPDIFPQSESPFSAEDLADAFNPSFRWGNSAKNLSAPHHRYTCGEMVCQLSNPEDYLWQGFMDNASMPYDEQMADELDFNLANAFPEPDSISD
ncbi:hypothetical protein L7F22_015991 [Adiantum nelumboides]|nr:hypothetical protein [Adiantum nelumboides]